MALNVDEPNRRVTPALRSDLQVYSFAMGSAQLLANGNYLFLAGVVAVAVNVVDS